MFVTVFGSLLLVLLLLLLGWCYRRAPYRALSAEKPSLVLFPKYRAEVILPRSVLSSPQPAEALVSLLRPHGFRLHGGKRFPLEFRRGRMLGDLSSRYLGLRLVFGEISGYSSRCALTLEGRCCVLFDSGDLWRVIDAIKRDLEKDAAPRWTYGSMPGDAPHIQLRDAETAQLLARVGQLGGGIRVQLNEALPSGSQQLMDAVIRQLDFYFGEKQEPDPWRYAIHHCSTAANLYSAVRWVFVAGRGDQH